MAVTFKVEAGLELVVVAVAEALAGVEQPEHSEAALT